MPEPSPENEFSFTASDGARVFVRKWMPESGLRSKGVLQIAHGAAEHSLRYERFARFLTQAGYVVYANDHRGHYRTADVPEKAGIAGPDGWNAMVGDLKQLTDIIRTENPGAPILLMGHSMGSLLVQQYIEAWGRDVTGVVLSGTYGVMLNLDEGIEALEPLAIGATATRPCALFAERFSTFNTPFEPGRTGFEWLSRDEAEVQKYVDDPWCGFPFSNALVSDMMKGAREIWKLENERRIPKHLPILMVSGEQDPVGADTVAVKLLADRYQANGLTRVTTRFYASARHELLNETNRDEVQRDILDWWTGLGRVRAGGAR